MLFFRSSWHFLTQGTHSGTSSYGSVHKGLEEVIEDICPKRTVAVKNNDRKANIFDDFFSFNYAEIVHNRSVFKELSSNNEILS
jgi:hypothetical protein